MLIGQRGKTECKVRGFTLNVRGMETLNYDTMKRKEYRQKTGRQIDVEQFLGEIW